MQDAAAEYFLMCSVIKLSTNLKLNTQKVKIELHYIRTNQLTLIKLVHSCNPWF